MCMQIDILPNQVDHVKVFVALFYRYFQVHPLMEVL